MSDQFAHKKQLILTSLENQNEVSKQLDEYIIQDHQSNASDVCEGSFYEIIQKNIEIYIYKKAISDYYQISQKLWKNNDHSRSFIYIQRAFQLAEQLRGSNHCEFYQCLESLGQHLVLQGRLYEAQFYFEKSLDCAIQLNGSQHEDVVWNYKALAEFYFKQGKYMLANQQLQKALSIQQSNNDLNCTQTLDTMFKMTINEWRLGNNIEKTKLELEWMLNQFQSKTSIKNDKLQSQITQELANINVQQYKFDEAQRLYQQFLSLEDDLDQTLDAYLNIGYIEMIRKDFKKANEIFEQCKSLVKDQNDPKFKKIAEQQTIAQQLVILN